MRPSAQIERLAAALQDAKAQAAIWRAQLISAGVTPEEGLPPWAVGLTPNEVVFMQVLLDKWPKPVSAWALEEALPKRDHVKERDVSLVRQYACRLRKRPWIGPAAIEQVRGRGLRCSNAFHALHGAQTDNPGGVDDD